MGGSREELSACMGGVWTMDGWMYVCAVKDLRRRKYDVVRMKSKLGAGFSVLALVSGFCFSLTGCGFDRTAEDG